jgi:hypothetical protein
VFNPARLWKMLGEFFLRNRAYFAFAIKYYCSGTAGALIQSQNVLVHLLRVLCYAVIKIRIIQYICANVKIIRFMKKAVIVGASSGMGCEVSKLLLARGWKIGVAARRESALSELKALNPEKWKLST